MKGYMYILECADGSFYTGSTRNLQKRLWEHDHFLGANYTRKKHPSKLVYFEEYPRIDAAFYREKQVQGWSRAKKKALINGKHDELPELAIAYRDVASAMVASRASATGMHETSATDRSVVEVLETTSVASSASATGFQKASATGTAPVIEALEMTTFSSTEAIVSSAFRQAQRNTSTTASPLVEPSLPVAEAHCLPVAEALEATVKGSRV